MIKTFTLAWLQVSLVALNTYQLANQHVIGALIVGFLISLVWCFNSQRAAFSTLNGKLVYASGAMAGTATGLILARVLY